MTTVLPTQWEDKILIPIKGTGCTGCAFYSNDRNDVCRHENSPHYMHAKEFGNDQREEIGCRVNSREYTFINTFKRKKLKL